MSNYLSYQFSKSINVHQNRKSKHISKRDENINSCLKLALSVAKKYHTQSGTSMSLEDIVQHANMGLCIAADKYNNPEVKFSAYAHFWIKKYVLDAINVIARPLAVSTHEGYCRVTDACKFVSKDDKFAGAADDVEGEKNPVFNKLVGSYIAGDTLADINDIQNNQANIILQLFNILSQKERVVICAKFGLQPFAEEHSFQEIAKKYKWTIVSVNKSYGHAIGIMQQYAIVNNINLAALLIDAASISEYAHYINNDIAYVDNVETDVVIDDYLKHVQLQSGLSDIQFQTALYKDDNNSYAFFSKKIIGNYVVYIKHRIARRYNNGNVNIDISFGIYNKEGDCVKPERYLYTIKHISIFNFASFAKEHNITQMHSPYFKL